MAEPRHFSGRAMKAALPALAMVTLVVVLLAERWGADQRDSSPLRPLKPLRLEVKSEAAHREFLAGLRAYHYRAEPQDEADYLNVYYDTEDWKLYGRGFSYRFRVDRGAPGSNRPSVRLEQEPRLAKPGEKEVDITSRLPTAVGDAVLGGEWTLALTTGEALTAAATFRELLSDFDIAIEDVQPRLVGELQLRRFAVRDKGRVWFEFDHETWSFRRFEESDENRVRFEDIVVDATMKRGDPELLRRKRTLDELAGMVPGVEATDGAPHERAISALTQLSKAAAAADA